MTTCIEPETTPVNAVAESEQLDDIRRRLVHSYDDKAGHYDVDRAVHSGLDFYFATSYEMIDALMGPTDVDTVHLDMPVGTGRFLFYLHDRGRRHRMLGVDISAGMLEVCRHGAAERGMSIGLTIGDGFRLPLPDSSVDILTSLRLFHLFPTSYWPAMLAEMQRVIRPGGFLITEMRNWIRGMACSLVVQAYRSRRSNHPHSFVAPQQVRRLFAGWADVQTQGIGLDGMERFHRITPPIARGLRMLEQHSPLRYLSKTLLIKAHKPGKSC